MAITTAQKWIFSVCVLVFAALTIIALLMFQPRLETIQNDIENDYQSVSHISASEFSKLDVNKVVVFDVREPEEFAVSHIAGAIQVMPNIDPSEFFQDYGDLLEGKQVVFYCSVGRRSSELANRLGDAPSEYGAVSSKNLIGGVFSWVNQSRLLRNSSQATTNLVHPYNKYWGRLVADPNRLSLTPQ
ncbi:MAG: rhodanese-related sulfurtransferase [Arenicella sp.]|jgi:rhodanese-related sulfurtransferase